MDVVVQLRVFITMAPDGGDCAVATSTSWNDHHYPLNRRLRRIQGCCGLAGGNKNFLTLLRIESRFIGRPTRDPIAMPLTLRWIRSVNNVCSNGILSAMENILIPGDLVQIPALCNALSAPKNEVRTILCMNVTGFVNFLLKCQRVFVPALIPVCWHPTPAGFSATSPILVSVDEELAALAATPYH